MLNLNEENQSLAPSILPSEETKSLNADAGALRWQRRLFRSVPIPHLLVERHTVMKSVILCHELCIVLSMMTQTTKAAIVHVGF